MNHKEVSAGRSKGDERREKCRFGWVYLPSCSTQGLSYTNVVLSPYLYLSSFSFIWSTFFDIISSSFSIYTSLENIVHFCVIQSLLPCISSNIYPLFFFSMLDLFYPFLPGSKLNWVQMKERWDRKMTEHFHENKMFWKEI